MIQEFIHLKSVKMDYTDNTAKHLIRNGIPGEPITANTAFGWTIMSSRKQKGFNQMLLARG